MNHARLTRFVTVTLVFILLLTAAPAPLPWAGVETAEAAFLGPNGILGLFRIGAALAQRNRVYTEAGATAEEINAYYDGLIARAQGVRKDFIAEARTGTRPAQFAPAYTRVEAALEAERRAAIQMIEAEKKQARRDFNRKLGKEITNILIAAPGGQRIIGRGAGCAQGYAGGSGCAPGGGRKRQADRGAARCARQAGRRYPHRAGCGPGTGLGRRARPRPGAGRGDQQGREGN